MNQTRYVVNSQPALSQVLVKEENGIKTFYVYGLGLIGEEKDGEYRAYHFDFRGSTVALSDKTGKVVQRFQYGPYGELVKGEVTQTPFLFNGKYGVMTEGNGLYYMRARFYSAEMKRFVNMDVLLGKVEEGQTLNRFMFVEGNPIGLIDPYGLETPNQALNRAIDIVKTFIPETYYENAIPLFGPLPIDFGGRTDFVSGAITINADYDTLFQIPSTPAGDKNREEILTIVIHEYMHSHIMDVNGPSLPLLILLMIDEVNYQMGIFPSLHGEIYKRSEVLGKHYAQYMKLNEVDWQRIKNCQ